MTVARIRAAGAAAALVFLSCAAAAPVAANSWPSRVQAVYKVSYLGIDIGTFRFNSSVAGNSYTLEGDAQLSIVLGAFKWSGATRSSGTVAGDMLLPAGYTYDYKANSKVGAVKIGFSGAAVSNVSVLPPSHPGPEHVPLLDTHLKNVLDPLTAIMAFSRGSTNPCVRKVAIFDGKQRFDLRLSPNGQQKVAEQRPSGQPNIAFVCRVRYVPIAGHRNNDANKQMADNANIEVALRPVPSANLFIPYRISIPTIAGTATLTAQRVDITTPGQAQIALVH